MYKKGFWQNICWLKYINIKYWKIKLNLKQSESISDGGSNSNDVEYSTWINDVTLNIVLIFIFWINSLCNINES